MRLVLLYFDETFVEKTAVHGDLSRRDVAEIFHHLGNLLFLEGCHRVELLLCVEMLGTQLLEKVSL